MMSKAAAWALLHRAPIAGLKLVCTDTPPFGVSVRVMVISGMLFGLLDKSLWILLAQVQRTQNERV